MPTVPSVPAPPPGLPPRRLSRWLLHTVGPRAYARWLTPAVIALVIGVFGAHMAGVRWDYARKVEFIGHSDEAAYAMQGKSLLAGKGLQIPYVTWFFIPYDPGVTRREDHWPPFLSFCMVPFYWAYGVSAPVAKLPTVLIGSIGLPLAAALLAWRLSRRGYVGIAAGLIVMGHHLMFTESLKTLSDVPAAMLVALFCWALIAARQSPWMHLLAGAFAALAYYAKGSEIILIGMYPGLAVLTTGLHWPTPLARAAYAVYLLGVLIAWPWTGGWIFPIFLALAPGMLMVAGPNRKGAAWPFVGFITGGLLLAPYLYSNDRLFHDPLHSTQNYVSGYIGLETWDPYAYRVYWGKHLPKTEDRWQVYGQPAVIDPFTFERRETIKTDAETGRFGSTPREYWSYTANARAEIARMILFGADWARYDRHRSGARTYRQDPWDSLGVISREWRAAAAGAADSPEMAAERARWSRGEAPNLTDIPQWDASAGLVAGAGKYLSGWAKRAEEWDDPVPRVVGLSAAGTTLVVLCVGPPLWLLVTVCRVGWRVARRRLLKWPEPSGAPHAAGEAAPAWLFGPVAALALLIVVHAALLAYFWEVVPRFAFVLVPLVTAVGLTGLSRALELPLWPAVALARRAAAAGWPRTLVAHWHVPVTCAVAIWALAARPRLEESFAAAHQTLELSRHGGGRENSPLAFPYGESHEVRYKKIGEYLKSRPELADAVIMCRNPWELLFYAADTQKGVAIPYDTPAKIFAVARYYRVTYLLWDGGDRPQLRDFLQEVARTQAREPNTPKSLTRIATVEGCPLYRIDYAKLPNATLPGMAAPPADPPPGPILPDTTISTTRPATRPTTRPGTGGTTRPSTRPRRPLNP